ncbi:MAG: hypothetical protein ACOYYS_28140 [Chloroflexota bacterium]
MPIDTFIPQTFPAPWMTLDWITGSSLVLGYALQVSCPQCRAAFFALKGNGSYDCPDCGPALAVGLG